MDSEAKRRIIVALDFDRLDDACRMARLLAPSVGMFKVGKQLFTTAGPEALRKLSDLGAKIFLDLKYHDIPNTVAGAVRAAVALPGVELLNVHALGGRAMMEAAVNAMPRGATRPKLLAVTILTSMDQRALREVGIQGTPQARAVRLAKLACDCGIDGVVASPLELRSIRKACGPKFLLVPQGIRPAGSNLHDQKRTASPAEAIRNGADYLGVGRAITQAADPVAAAAAIAAEIAAALRARN
ncbi:MAG TPA: orotidine-5'-phosphate decarboxylase [Candidatus Acidoferrales bacterium]|nr:orotidine-5'-phosphate decarboxylase [Candidatus Acidoferrales bacterium]